MSIATQQDELTVGEVALAAGVRRSAVRFYEKQHLPTAMRTSGNQRRFGPEAACRIKVARVAQRVGLSIAEIQELLSVLPTNPTVDDWAAVANELRAETARRIADLERAMSELTRAPKICDIDPDPTGARVADSAPRIMHTPLPSPAEARASR